MPPIEHRGAGCAPGRAAPEWPEKDEVRELAGGADFGDQGKADGADRSTVIPPADPAAAAERTRMAEKRLATVRAELAFKSTTVHVVHEGYLACRWGYCKELPTIDALERFAVLIGARGAA